MGRDEPVGYYNGYGNRLVVFGMFSTEWRRGFDINFGMAFIYGIQ